MHYQTGNMREIHNDLSPYKSAALDDRDNDIDYRSRYQKSEASYIAPNNKSRLHYDQSQPQRSAKQTQNWSQQCINLPIKIKSTQREDYCNTFKVQLLNVIDKNNNCFTIHITNDNDSLFLWSFYVREAEYLNLKNLLCLKVDFHRFPEVIISYLNQCNTSNQAPGSSRYYAVLDVKKGNIQAEFKIMQANKFKQSLHFSLIFKKGNDQQIKNYLSQKFDKQRKENVKLHNQLMDAQNQSSIRMKNLQKLRVQYEMMQKQKNQKIFQLERREKDRVKEVTLRFEEDSMRRQKSQHQKNSRTLADLNDKIQELKLKNQDLQTKYQTANQKIINLESSQKSLNSKCQMLETKAQSYQKSNKQLRSKELKSNEQYHTLKNQNTKLTCLIQSLQDKLKQKQQRLSQNLQVKSNNYNQISNLQQNIRQQKQKNGRLEEKISTMELEISKLLQKNQDLMNKYQKKKDKVNELKSIMIKQEDQIEEFMRKRDEDKNTISGLNQDKQRLELQIRDRQIKIKDYKKNIECNQEHIENQQKIVSSLHKQLNQRAIGTKSIAITSTLPTYTGPSYTGFSSSSSVNRQLSSTLSSTSQSRIKYSPSPISTSPINDRQSQRVAPPFRKYRQGIENDKDQQNSHQSHSRSPIVNKLNQQLDPQDNDKTRHKIAPIKFSK